MAPSDQAYLYIRLYIYSAMSKLSRHAAIRQAVNRGAVASQDDLRRLLYRSGHRVTQATLSRDIHELGLVKTAEGYTFPNGNGDLSDAWLPSVEKLIRDFVYEVRAAQNLVVVKTSAGSAQPVAAAIDAEEWPEIVGTVAGDDVILVVAPDNKVAEKLVTRVKGLLA
jgi:transcriptional regulator of arginine metabolism